MQQGGVVAVVGATSMVGRALLPILERAGFSVVAYSRNPSAIGEWVPDGIEWRDITTLQTERAEQKIADWIWLAPIAAIPEQLENIRRAGGRRVVAVSTTSRFTKKESSSAKERKFVDDLIAAENRLQAWASENSITWTILRPTLIYGLGMDRNVGVIARFIRRFHFFPILGAASGLRQPIHARDVAAACEAVLKNSNATNQAYNISGAEVLSYREMVRRIFGALQIRPRFISIPLWMFAVGVSAVRGLRAFRNWSPAMAERMNQDLAFDHEDAARDFGFAPQAFILEPADLPDADSRH